MAGEQLLAIAFLLVAGATAVAPHLKGHKAALEDSRTSTVTLDLPVVKHRLTVCNAYRATGSLDIRQTGQSEPITKSKPLKYKECEEFTMPLADGDRLDFRSNDRDIGTFFASGMPKVSSSLLLIARAKDGTSRRLAFDSHAFADLKAPQIAVIDAYHGSQHGTVNIVKDPGDSANRDEAPLTEALRYNSVVAVTPGKYQISLLDDAETGHHSVVPLRAGDGARCVIMRVGGGSQKGLALPQELVVFDSSAVGRWASPILLVTIVSILFSISLH